MTNIRRGKKYMLEILEYGSFEYSLLKRMSSYFPKPSAAPDNRYVLYFNEEN